MRAWAIAAGFVSAVVVHAAFMFADRGVWWPMWFVGIACVALFWLGRQNDKEIRRLLAERSRQRNEEA